MPQALWVRWLLWQTGGHFAMLHICLFRWGMGRTCQAEHIQGCVLRTSCLQMTCRYTLNHHRHPPLPNLLLIKRLVETQTSAAAQRLQPDAGWRRQVVWGDGRRKEGRGQAYTLSLSVRRHDKETQELVYMRQWENKLKIPAGTQMHIKTGLF